jgi:hypothetical protein
MLHGRAQTEHGAHPPHHLPHRRREFSRVSTTYIFAAKDNPPATYAVRRSGAELQGPDGEQMRMRNHDRFRCALTGVTLS